MSKKEVKNKKNPDPLERIALPKVKLDKRAKKSIWIIIILALGLISLLGLFNLSGRFGQFLSDNLALAFGWGKWAWPLILLAWGWLLYKGKQYHINFFNYFGLFLLFVSYQTLFHFFIKDVNQKSSVLEHFGGGYVGYYLSMFFHNILGGAGGLIVLAGLFFISLILIFNTSLHRLFGPESELAKASRSVTHFFQKIFGRSEPLLPTTEEEEFFDEEEEEHLQKVSMWGNDKNAKESSKNLVTASNAVFKEKVISDLEGKVKPAKVTEKNIFKTRSVKIDLPLDLLNRQTGQAQSGDIDKNSLVIQHTLEKFGIPVEMGASSVGPTVTQYTFKPAEGIKLSRITALSNDLSLALAAHPIRIEAPIPGKSLVGIEVPNKTKAIVGLREILEDRAFKTRNNNLLVALGKDVAGANWLYDITKMPHLLVAGATNSGKSVCLNAIIASLLYQNSAETLRFIMVDPKRVELPAYNGIPHLLTPVITEVSKTINALKWCLNEMDRRYDMLNKAGKKNIQSYNAVSKEKLPFIVFVIDELADLMVAAARDIEGSIIRLTQMSRAVGIHLVLATQRPSVDVITGLIKANIPARIAFSVASAIDSKTILDCSGAEKLLGKGDMLFSAAEMSKPKRLQGAFLSDEEITKLTDYIKEHSGEAEYIEGVTERQKVSGVAGVGLDGTFGDEDELMQQAKEIVIGMGRASTSLLQRRLRIGYGRAASILDALEEAGIVGPSNGSKPREILVSQEQLDTMSEGGIAGMPVHDRKSASAPENYFGDDEEGDDGTLEFEADEEEIAPAIPVKDEEVEEEAEEEIAVAENEDDDQEEEQTDDKREVIEPKDDDFVLVDSEHKEAKQEEPKKPTPTLRALSDDEDEGMFFSR
jgi:S-DNA-T family DNA segregation ATPase FtsK/SpoIIIE